MTFVVFVFILIGICSVSWVCKLLIFIRFGKLGAFISADVFYTLAHTVSWTQIIHMLHCLMSSYRAPGLYSLVFLLSVCASFWIEPDGRSQVL